MNFFNFFTKTPNYMEGLERLRGLNNVMHNPMVGKRETAPMLLSKDQLLLMKSLLEKAAGDYNNLTPEFLNTYGPLLNYVNMCLLMYFKS